MIEDLSQNIRDLVTSPKIVNDRVLTAHESTTLHDLEPFAETPYKVETRQDFLDIDLFAAYFEYMNAATPALKLDFKRKTIKAVFDFHGNADNPKWGTNDACFFAEFDLPFKQWLRIDKDYQSQKKFAEFLEDRCMDCVSPNASEIMTMILNFEETTHVVFKSDIRIQDGAQNLVYNDSERTSNMKIPKEIILSLPVFKNREPIEVKVRLKVRAREGKLLFATEIVNQEQLIEDQFKLIVDELQSDLKGRSTPLPVIIG